MKRPTTYETAHKPHLNKPCCTCGKLIKSPSYLVVGEPGCRARGKVWPDGLYTHTNCRPGTKKWYNSLGRPVPGFRGLFSRQSDAIYKRLYEGALFNRKEDGDGAATVPA